ncbi:GNAT family N-acetyltransferase [Cupriavidus nantongensis]|uniref:GNAT family N-acetyltransferase n=1 Tax=Cupriavidus nantongensis TaxID=1796606 RepID=UPI0022475CE7|nr:GNAT family N-acetyltransferase [Cupriavidus nantongensis]
MSSSASEPVSGVDVGLIWERACSGVPLKPCSLAVRHLQDGDLEGLALLVHTAFAGTVDSAPLERWRRKLSSVLGDQYGSFLPAASFVAQTSSGEFAGTVLATDFPLYQAPVIALIAVAPGAQHRGVGSCLLRRSLGVLAQEGFANCRAKISSGNNASLALFRSTGFEPCRVVAKPSPQAGG